ncbi:Pleiotropic drug resistance protein 3 [Camellia lanceoleosa]|uniref:Pleiotropic drug resistance protein 3 n=1 Tax=Camellia lanceoleosa TaxID=1840588 RepID=A0ACC0IUY2_9ERIC|nr:Pleiotropic drug resistance protein 3 [Camellia lanceoleosa]
MAQLVGDDEIESLRIELAEIGRSLRSSFQRHTSSFRSISALSSVKDDVDDECALQWAAIERLPTFERLRSSLFDENDGSKVDAQGKRVVDVTKLDALERNMFIDRLIKHIENDNLRLLHKQRKRIDKVGVKLPTVEVRYNNLRVEAECEVVHGKPLPTLWNSFKSILFDLVKLPGMKSQEARITIVDDISGIIKPGRMTLLLGPPGCGKTTLLKALSGNLNKSLKVAGEVSYNGYKLEEFIPQKTSAYISQNDLHIPEMTVRETLDFSPFVSEREKQAGIVPDPDIDTYMKAISVEGQKTTLQTDYMIKILGLDICADTLAGDAMRRGISGGQKKRLTTGEMIVGPTKALFMDEISNGLDSSTTYQIVACLQQLAHIADATILVALLQPAPETFDLFDDIILMTEGKIVYHGPRSHILEFFEDCGFRCPERKGVADFLQEVMSKNDQAQYWHQAEQPCNYISADMFSKKFKESNFGKNHKNAISFSIYSLSKWALFRACISRELLLMRRNSFIYVFKSVQLVIIASITMTVFLRTRLAVDAIHANYYLGALFYALIILFFDGFPELSMTVGRLAVFYKQRDLYFYPAWAYAIPATILKVPLSMLVALVWTSLTYYVIGYSPEAGRFFRQFLLSFAVHLAATSMFRFLASIFHFVVASNTAGSMLILFVFLFSGFLIPKSSMPTWLSWGFWLSPMTYGEIGLALNEFLAPRWQKTLTANTTIGQETLESRGLHFHGYLFWISFSALLGFVIIFNIGFTLALTFLNPPGSRAIISNEKLSQIQGSEDSSSAANAEAKSTDSPNNTTKSHEGRVVLPFEPLTLVFQNVQYYVDTPVAMRERGFTQKKLQLLCDITGVFRPGVLTALMGVSGAGKTTLMDVLAGRKTSGTIEGDIRIGGFPKVQETFARISGYCEQTDIHSPQITVEESVVYSAWLRLHPEIDSKTKFEFVKEVLEIIELDEIKDCLVGMPGLVANPSIIFMDEPTTGLDARAAAIVMRAVNVAETGRTIVCTIHQPSIDIFEAFDELILLKSGGRIIYSGPLGQHSSSVIKYFEDISGVPKIKNNYNPATWMLDVTSTSAEAELGVDFAQVYKNSVLYQNNRELVNRWSTPPPDSKELYFATRFAQNGWGQFKCCLWKQHLSYWRSPAYNLQRFVYMIVASFLFGVLFWEQGKKLKNQQSLFNVFGSMFSATIFLGINNCSSVLPYISTERSVLFRERFAGMYGSWAYALAQVTIEIPYLLAISITFVVITYPMIGYYWSAYKVFWYFYAMFCTLLYFNYLGMLLIAMTPSFPVAAILQSAFYTIFNFVLDFDTSTYGDIDQKIKVFGETKTVTAFLTDYFGYRHDHLPIVAVMLLIYPIVFASLFAFCIGKLNFQRR